ncbi:MAG: hypothetical protein ACQEQO_04520 [Thermodesulfobacteriota bacterium]
MVFKKNINRSLLFLLWICFSLSIFHIISQASEEEDKIKFSFPSKDAVKKIPSPKPSWKRIETKHTIIQYETIDDLKQFDGKIDYSKGRFTLKGLFSGADPNDPGGSIKRKVDLLFERVQEILDMRRKTNKVIMNLYPNKKRLHEAYFAITHTECRIRAWYIYESNTIYINKDDVHAGMLAHEMAHSIIDHYFSARPPRATAEILARYVDRHLYY